MAKTHSKLTTGVTKKGITNILPGESKPSARPLVPLGSEFATTDYSAAVELARNLYHQAIFNNQNAGANADVSNIASLASAYTTYVKQYYVDEHGNTTKEANDIRYSLTPLTNQFVATLGHTNMSDTAIYAEWNQGLADEAAKRFG